MAGTDTWEAYGNELGSKLERLGILVGVHLHHGVVESDIDTLFVIQLGVWVVIHGDDQAI
jgi:hypothetical protein